MLADLAQQFNLTLQKQLALLDHVVDPTHFSLGFQELGKD